MSSGRILTAMTRNAAIKTAAVGAACLAVGAGGGILGDAGAKEHGAQRGQHGQQAQGAKHAKGGAKRLARAVHVEAVVPGKEGFRTITIDRGFLTARDGAQLTLRQGTPKKTWRTQTFTVPAGAKVRRDRASATLDDLKTGDIVRIVHGAKKTRVLAHPPRRR